MDKAKEDAMHDYPHLRLHRSRIEEAARHRTVAIDLTHDERPRLVRALHALIAPGRRQARRVRATVRYAGSGVAGDRVE